MSDIFAFAIILSAILFVLGIFSPKISLFWQKDKEKQTRLHSAGIYALAFIASFVGFGLNRPIEIPEMKEPKSKEEKNQKDQRAASLKDNLLQEVKPQESPSKPTSQIIAKDFCSNFKSKGYKIEVIKGPEGENYICTQETDASQFVVDVFQDTEGKILQIKCSSLAYQGNADQVAHDFLIYSSSLIFQDERATTIQKWVGQNIGKNEILEKSGIKFQISANAESRILNISFE